MNRIRKSPAGRLMPLPPNTDRMVASARNPRALTSPNENPDCAEIRSPLVEEQENTNSLGKRKKRSSLGNLSRMAGFLL